MSDAADGVAGLDAAAAPLSSSATVEEEKEQGLQEEEKEQDPSVSAALYMLAFYRKVLSPMMPSTCRFIPSCSNYSIQSYKSFGFAKGTVLTAWRLLRCNPLNPSSGLDLPRWPPSWGSVDQLI